VSFVGFVRLVRLAEIREIRETRERREQLVRFVGLVRLVRWTYINASPLIPWLSCPHLLSNYFALFPCLSLLHVTQV